MSERTCEGCGTALNTDFVLYAKRRRCDECAVAMPLEEENQRLRALVSELGWSVQTLLDVLKRAVAAPSRVERKRIEAALAAAAPSAPLIPQSRADAMVAEEREAAIKALANVHRIAHDFDQNGDRCDDRFETIEKAIDDEIATIRARKTEANRG